jgi:hypothetical protein
MVTYNIISCLSTIKNLESDYDKKKQSVRFLIV